MTLSIILRPDFEHFFSSVKNFENLNFWNLRILKIQKTYKSDIIKFTIMIHDIACTIYDFYFED